MDKNKSLHPDKKGNSFEGNQINPQSPGKRRMVDSPPVVRLISRGGCTTESDEEVEVIRTQVNRQPSLLTSGNIIKKGTRRTEQQPILDTAGSRKRKTVTPVSTPVVILPSPTTQIARRIDSINLETLSSAPTRAGSDAIVEKRRLTPSTVQKVTGERMEQSSPTGMTVVESPYNASKNVSIEAATNIRPDELLMERYLQRGEEAGNMKRAMTQEKGEEESNHRKSKGGSKLAKTGSGYQPELNHSTRVPTTIHQSSSSSSSSIQFPTTATTTLLPPITPVIGQHLPPFSLPLLPFSSLPLPASTSPQHQSKTKSFSINDLLAKEPTPTATTPIQQTYSYINPSLLLLYQQWVTQQLATAATMSATVNQRFQGEPAETDSKHGSLNTVGSPSKEIPVGGTISKSPMRSSSSSVGHYSPHTSPPTIEVTEGPTVEITTGDHIREDPSPKTSTTSSNTEKEGEVNEVNRQNALLQVSEAHLAILPDEDGDTPLHLAIIQENIPLTFYLVRLITGVSMNLDIANNLRQTPLHLAVITGQPMLVNLLVQAGASINHPDRRGNTCVHLAAQRKNVSILQILSQAENHSPDYNAKNFAGLTPVHIATREGSIEVLKFLFQMGANRNMADSCSGRTALHYAVEAQNFQVCNFLLENNVNVNAVTFSGNTPLHVAAGRRLKEIVAILMAYGANPAIANGEGDFPSDLPASLLMQRAKMGNR